MVAGSKKHQNKRRRVASSALGLSLGFGLLAVSPLVGSLSIASAQAASNRVVVYTWNDFNKDKINNDGAAGLGNVKIEAIDASGTVVASASSDSAGNAAFDVATGVAVTVRFTGPLGWDPMWGVTGSNSDGTKFYEVAFVDGTTALQMGFNNPSAPAPVGATSGSSTGGAITSNTVWEPNKGAPAAGVVGAPIIQATASPSTVAPTTVAPTTTVPDTLPPIGGKPTTTIAAAPTTTVAPAGAPAALAPVKVCGEMYNDKNSNGVKDAGEAPLVGATLKVTGTNGFSKDLVADDAGKFCIDGLTPGDYTNELTGSVDGTLPAELKGQKRTFTVNADGTIGQGQPAATPAAAAASASTPSAPAQLAATGAARTRRQAAGALSALFAGMSLIAGARGSRKRED